VPPGAELILIAHDVGPADVAELAQALAGIALAGGGVTAHAAIVARSLGIPMVTGLGEAVLEVAEGTDVYLDGSTGELALDRSEERTARAAGDMYARKQAARRAHALRDEPAVTTDGVQVKVLANVASPEELKVALRAGAEGVGLLRTELAFLDAEGWPSKEDHLRMLNHVIGGLSDRPAVVRVLDFGADKCPPFLRGIPERGIALLLENREAFISQIAAILTVAQAQDLQILLPLVDTLAQVAESRALIEQVARRSNFARIPPLGAMIETPVAAQNAASIAEGCAFLSIGTNDLTATTLGVGRLESNAARAHHPRVLRAIARTVEAAHVAGVPIEVCGEAASEPTILPLLVGLGIDEVSVGAARVGQVRDWIRQLDSGETAGLARSALTMDSAEEVEWMLRPVAVSLQRAEADSAIHAVGS
jgi:phosphoenolpyruvate-protein kinase (PTS system EI component)